MLQENICIGKLAALLRYYILMAYIYFDELIVPSLSYPPLSGWLVDWLSEVSGHALHPECYYFRTSSSRFLINLFYLH